jgi:Zn-dependent peptidase ImmA (M78 family)
MPLGHVRNLTETLEKAFCMIHVFDFGTDDIDEITQWVEPLPPIILVNRRVPGDRLRFSLAHALGHLVMHHGIPPYPLMEKEANQFAGAFLMPERDIRHDLKPVTIERMLGLKPLWKVSIGAMIMRARELNLITDKREKSLHPIPVERPTLSTKLLGLYLDERQYSHAELAQLLHTKEHRFREWYMPDDPQIRLVPKKESSRSIG